ncbi:MAG: hypothetical protein WC528_01800 [Patescibacteria group bacterium]
MVLDERKSALLSAIIKEHIKSGLAVGSKILVDKYGFHLSPATIRHEMTVLEKKGYIFQPHTSAGRIPTEAGWQFYLNNSLKDKSLSAKEKGDLDAVFKTFEESELKVKNLAKKLAEISREAVIVGFNPDYIYYTGLSQLFRQPEFTEYHLIFHLSEVIDHLEEVITRLFKEVAENDFKILVGQQNPFGPECGAIVSKFKNKKGEAGIFTLLGPARMAYENNLALLKYSHSLLSTI